MRKTLSFFLVWLILLNALGYYPVYLCMQWKAQWAIKQQLENNMIGDEEFYTISVAIDLPPYWNPEHPFVEPIEGQIFAGGEFYKLYKQVIHQDSLTLLCVKDHTQKYLFETLSDWVKVTINGLPGTSEEAGLLLSALIKHFYVSKQVVVFFLFDFTEIIHSSIQKQLRFYEYFKIHSPPPEFLK